MRRARCETGSRSARLASATEPLLTADRNQIAYFPGPVVADCDDPMFTDREVELLSRPNLRAYVVVNERVAAEYRRLGVDKPCYVIPHGVSLASVSGARRRRSGATAPTAT